MFEPVRESDVPQILSFIRELAEYEKLVHDIDFYKNLRAIPMDEWTVFRLDSSAVRSLADLKD